MLLAAMLLTGFASGRPAPHLKQARTQIARLADTVLPHAIFQILAASTADELNAALHAMFHNELLGQHHRRRIGFNGFVGEKGDARVSDPRAVQVTGGDEIGEHALPALNAALAQAINDQLDLIEAAQAGDLQARERLSTRSAEARSRHEAWLNDPRNVIARMSFVDRPRQAAEQQELRHLQNLFVSQDWGEGSPGGYVFTGTAEQLRRYHELSGRFSGHLPK